MSSISNTAAGAALQVVNTPTNSGGAVNTNGELSADKDQKIASTDPKFGEVWQQIQAKYGAKAEKPREIKKTLGKDDFLRIMITQMKNQDPTSPFKPDQMAAQMAQFASVEQLQNMNQSIQKMSTQNSPMERMSMTNMIGKVVTVDKDRFPHTEGSKESLSFNLPKNASAVSVSVMNDAGETELQKELGPLKVGENAFTWDGLKANTLPAKAGTYILKVDAKDENGATMQLSSQAQARVIGVSFEGAEPVFLIGNAQHQDKITMKNIVRIDADLNAPAQPSFAAPMPPSAPPLASAPPEPKETKEVPVVPVASLPPKKNFIAYQKGVGSSNLDGSANPEVAAALARYQEERAAAEAAAKSTKAPTEEKGFPNGLQDEGPAVSAPSSNSRLGNNVSLGNGSKSGETRNQ